VASPISRRNNTARVKNSDMKKDKWRNEWHPCDLSMMISLSGVTETPGQLTQMPMSGLNISLQNMPGIETVYISGYIIPQDNIPKELFPVGEFVLLRSDDDVRKAYNYAFAVSGDSIYFNGPYKYFDGHHTPLSGVVNIDACFGNIPNQEN